jgi:tyrosyl-tRNA synthetase
VASGALHPMEAKMRLAQEVISDFHGEDAARKAAEYFQRVFRDGLVPAEMSEVRLNIDGGTLNARQPTGLVMKQWKLELSSTSEKWSRLVASLGLVGSTSEAERVIKQGGFELNGIPVKDPTCKIDLDKPATYEVRVGKKKFLRIVIE